MTSNENAKPKGRNRNGMGTIRERDDGKWEFRLQRNKKTIYKYADTESEILKIQAEYIQNKENLGPTDNSV